MIPARSLLTLALGTAAFGFVLGYLGPTLDDLDEARATQAALQDAEAAARRQARQQAAAEALCGPHGTAVQLQGGAWRCINKHGLKAVLTARVQL